MPIEPPHHREEARPSRPGVETGVSFRHPREVSPSQTKLRSMARHQGTAGGPETVGRATAGPEMAATPEKAPATPAPRSTPDETDTDRRAPTAVSADRG